MKPFGIDILMITHNRPAYTAKSLARLLETCGESTRVWVWQNGNHAETVAVVRSFSGHPNLYQVHFSDENVKLNPPTNWLWSQSSGEFLGKVDDDCIVPYGWIETLAAAHEKTAKLGAIGCWHYRPEDTTEEMLRHRLARFEEHWLLNNCWIGGSGYLLKRAAQREAGLLAKGQSWTNYLIKLAARGWTHGWYYPFLYQDHMDDPRSPGTAFKSDADVRRMAGLTNLQRGLSSVQAVLERQQQGLEEILSSSLDPVDYIGLRARLQRMISRFWLS